MRMDICYATINFEIIYIWSPGFVHDLLRMYADIFTAFPIVIERPFPLSMLRCGE